MKSAAHHIIPASGKWTACHKVFFASLAFVLLSNSALCATAISTVDGGGRRSTSANYTVDDSIDGMSSFSTAVSPAITMRQGYIGQLYEVISMVSTAIPASVSEVGSSQLSGFAALDDGTILVLPGSAVSWDAATYPIASISASGQVTPSAVYTDTTGAVSGYYLGASNSVGLLVLDTNPDNYGLYASDSVPDLWQIRFFGLDNASGVAAADPDGDRQDNGREYLAGTIPTNTSSALRIIAVAKEANDIRIAWTSVGGHSYVLQSTDPFTPPAYTGVFADSSPIISVLGTAESTTNYLDIAAAYAPVLTSLGNQAPAGTGTPSTVYISATTTRGLADASSGAVAAGSLLVLGTFSISDAAIQSNFTARNLGAIMSAFTAYDSPIPVGEGTGFPASWDAQRSAAGFGGQQIYLVAIDAPTAGKASQLGVFTTPSWVFPADGDQVDIGLEDVTDFVIGANGGSLTIGLVFGQTYTFDDTARLTALPGRARYYRVRLVP